MKFMIIVNFPVDIYGGAGTTLNAVYCITGSMRQLLTYTTRVQLVLLPYQAQTFFTFVKQITSTLLGESITWYL